MFSALAPTSSFRYEVTIIFSSISYNASEIVGILQNGFPKSEAIIRDACRERGLTISKLHMSEFIKADGALTCCSVLFSMEN